MNHTSTPEDRRAAAVAGMVAALPAEVRAELSTLAGLGDEHDVAVSWHWLPDLDAWEARLQGQAIGVVSRQWLDTGVAPDGFGPPVDDGLP